MPDTMSSSEEGFVSADLRRRRRLLGLVGLLAAVGAVSIFAVGASGAAYAATASVSPQTTYLNDAGAVFTFTVTNVGTTTSIGAVEIRRPDGNWTVNACNGMPAGWTAQRSDPMCRFRSGAAAADDILPGESRTFQVTVATAPGAADRVGVFAVTVSKSNQFDNPSQLLAAIAAPGGLAITAHSFQVLDAVLATSAAAPGSACPAASKTANVDAIVTVVICGKNRSTGAQTPAAPPSSLGGTLLSSTGTFSSGSIAGNSASSVVLGSWTGAQIRTLGGTGLTIVAVIASDATHTSPSTTLGGYTAFNTDPVATDDEYDTNEDQDLVVLAADGVLANDTDADGHSLTAALGTDVSNGVLALAADGSFTYDPNDNFDGDDTFTYTVSDGHGGSDTGSVTIHVNGVNDPPVAADGSFGNAVGNTLFAVSRPATPGPVAHATGNLLTGSSDLDGDTLSVVAGTVASTGGGSATLFADGTFTYISAPGETGTADTFDFTVSDGNGGTDTATASITLTGQRIWYVDSSAGAGDGRSTTPFNTLAPLRGAGDVDDPNETIFVFSGGASLAGGITLEGGQQLLGQPAGLTAGSLTLLASGTGTRPVITNALGNGVTISSGSVVRSIAVNNASGNGIWGTGTTSPTLDDLTLSGNGASALSPASGIALENPAGVVTITDTTVTGSRLDNLAISSTSGSVTVQVSDSTFSDNASTTGNHGARVAAGGTSAVTATFDTVTFDGNRIDGLQGATTGTATLDLDVTGSTFDSNFVGVELIHGGSGSLTGLVDGNDFDTTLASGGAAVNVFLASSAGSGAGSILAATVTNNTIDNNGSAVAPAVWYHTGFTSGHARLALAGNTVSGVGHRGIALEAGTGGSTLDASLTGNAVSVGAGGLEAIYVSAGTVTADTVSICANISGNTAGSVDTSDIRVRQRFAGTTFRLPGYAGSGTDDAAVAAFLLAQNTATDAVAAHASVTGFTGGGACAAP